MDFFYDDTQRALADLARQVFTDHATHYRLKELSAGGQSFDADLWTALRGAGLLDVGVSDGGLIEQCVVLVEQGRTVAPVPLWAHYVGAPVVGSPDGLVTVCIDGSGVPALDEATSVVRVAGSEVFVADPGSLKIIERRETTAGFPEFSVEFGATERSEGDGAQLALRAVVALCALGVGVAERALELTAAYTTERKQFDRPLGSFQAVQQRAADAYIDVEAMRSTMWQAAWRLSEGLDAAREVAIAKFWAAEGGQRVVSAAQHLHGGLGADIDYPLHRYTLWSKWIELSFGGATPTLARLGAELAT
ncbi:MAG TPA: acyl-CoA dehydrogenase family protein [Actinomycetota bacterium]|jgi:alkylation response protein AidB-like acyl-CoA dehydrogenase|nr:acyl-CoA dehydrogenase family protein [Actinomycetota bacterium]